MPNFKELKQKISISDVLGHYKVLEQMKQRGDELRSACPIHKGNDKSSFSVSIEKNSFHCFACKAHGDILDFVVIMEGCSKYKAGLLLEEWFSATTSFNKNSEASLARVHSVNKRAQEKKKHSSPIVKSGEEEKETSDINPPLTFVLKNLDCKHSYLLNRVAPETANTFGLGVCNKGMMKDRLVIPIHNEHGEVVAYAGRALDKTTEESEGKYKFPPTFKKGYVLFNLWRTAYSLRSGEPLILVEGFFDVFRLYELGYKNVVALMGSVLTHEQEASLKAVVPPTSRVALLFDDDKAGHTCQHDVINRLGSHCFVKAVNLPCGVIQPDQLLEKINLF